MRNIDRIDNFMYEVGDLWKKNVPDWRFGQLMFNFISQTGDPFYLEEDEFLRKLKAYLENQK